MKHTKQGKYNADEVRITRVSIGLFAFFIIAASVWTVSRYRLVIGPFMPLIAGICTAAAVVLGILTYRAKKAGAEFQHKVFSLNYIFFLTAVLAGIQLFLLCTMPVDYWAYSVPEAYVLLAACFVIYVGAYPLGRDFTAFGILTALLGFGGMCVYQTYFNSKQNFISSQLLPADTVYKIGWAVLAALFILLLVLHFKKTQYSRIWKSMVSLAAAAIYWLLLSKKWVSAFPLTWIFAGTLTFWFILLCVLRRFKIVK